jgi:hypothetical protein
VDRQSWSTQVWFQGHQRFKATLRSKLIKSRRRDNSTILMMWTLGSAMTVNSIGRPLRSWA